MRKRNISPIRVGLIVTLASIIIIFVIMFIDERGGIFASYITIKGSFSTVSGLRKGAIVFLKGVDIGEVSDIYYMGEDVMVEMNILKRALKNIPDDSKAIIKTQGLLGDKMIEIIPGNSPVNVKEGAVIKGESEGEIYENIAEAGVVIKKAGKVMESLQKIVRDVEMGEGTLGMLYKDKEFFLNLKKSVDDFQFLMNELKETVKEMKETARVINQNNSLARTIVKMEKTADELLRLLSDIKQGKGSAGKILVDEEFYTSLTETVKEMKDLFSDVKKNPKKYFNIKIF